METGRVSGSKERTEGDAARSLADLFAVLWNSLADVLGTAATATLMRRAAQRAAPRCPELGELVIKRTSLDYDYETPAPWKERGGDSLRELVRELRPLLVDLTGPVVINHLERIPELQENGLTFGPEEPP